MRAGHRWGRTWLLSTVLVIVSVLTVVFLLGRSPRPAVGDWEPIALGSHEWVGLSLDADGRFEFADGCNVHDGRYQRRWGSDTYSVEWGAQTIEGCDAVLPAQRLGDEFRVEGTRLLFTGNHGKGVVFRLVDRSPAGLYG